MREILFRGKRVDNGEWVEGLPIKTYDTEIGKNSVDYANPVPVVLMASGRIVLECGYDEVPFFNIDEYPIVDPETVGLYTGLTDKNGLTKIFEGDIVTCDYFCGVVNFHEGAWCVTEEDKCPEYLYDLIDLKIIGNIHDNPELLKGE